MSTYLSNSEITQFNTAVKTGWFPVSEELALVTSLAKAIFHDSEGAFDPTISPLVDAWGFGPQETAGRPPAKEELQRLRAMVGMDGITVRREPPSLRKRHPKMTLDLSAIAKGHGVDRVADALVDLGYANYMVEIGGEIRVLGENPTGTSWVLGIEKPVSQVGSVQKEIRLRQGALATSGDYRNYREVDGRRLSHIIDPSTGYPIDHRLVSVSVIDETCAMADGWATALLVMGPKRALATANRLGLAAFLLVRSEEGLVEQVSDRFAALASQIETSTP